VRIWHYDTVGSPTGIDGVTTTMWLLASSQAQQGHEVTLFVHSISSSADAELAARSGILLRRSSRRPRAWAGHVEIPTDRPDIVHFHSAFIPSHARLASTLRRARLPYVTTLHGALSPRVLDRHGPSRRFYAGTIERPYLRRAAALSALHDGEARDIEAFLEDRNPHIEVIGNPVENWLFDAEPWRPTTGPPSVAFLGRFDPYHKGLDRLVAIAERIPDVEFLLYGAASRSTAASFERLMVGAPRNVLDRGPVYGDAKRAALTQASMYIQLSRWEGQSISIAEALALGVPVAVTEGTNLGDDVRRFDLGVVLTEDADEAAAALRAALDAPSSLCEQSANARTYARERFEASAVALRYLSLYGRVSEGVD
jgi:glycosyltransferase involved in cell wall biosynthesis